MVWAWRQGMRADFLFTYSLFEMPALFAFLFLVLGPTIDWFRGREFDWIKAIWSAALICAVYAACFSLGFVHGKLRGRKNEGIIGQTR